MFSRFWTAAAANTARVRYLNLAVPLLAAFFAVTGNAFSVPTFDAGTSLARRNPPDSEISGIDSSVSSPGVYWMHGDSDGVRVHATDNTLQRLGTYTFSGAPDSANYEDIAIGPGPVAGVSYIYFGDIGDNGFNRWNIRIYRMPEPVVYTRQAGAPVSKSYATDVWEYITIHYPPYIPFISEVDAEGLMVDPRNGDMYITSKESNNCSVFRAPASSFVDGATVNVSEIATKNFDKATAACISPYATELIIRGGSWAYLYQIASGQTIQAALGTSRISVPLRSEPQGEAIGYERSGSGYLTISEGNPVDLWYFARTSNDGPTPQETIIAPEAQWRYIDNGSDQGTAWRNTGFNDSGWSMGLSHMGYGDGDEQTVLGYGGNPSNKYVTNYFRKTFCVDTSVAFQTLKLRVVWEGGVAVYLNGTQVFRQSLASGAAYNTLATAARGVTKYSWLTYEISPALLVNGKNTIAVETHLASVNQPDMSFDFQLEGTRVYPVQTYPITLVTQSEPPGLTVPSFSMDGGATTIATGEDRSFWVQSSITNNNLPYTAFEATTDQYNLGADGDPVCRCTDYADGGDSRCWPHVTVTNARLYKGNATWPAADHFDWYDVYYPTGPVTITATHKAREIPVTYGPYVSGPAVVYHAVTGHSIVVTPAVRPGYNLTGVSSTSGVATDLGNGTWRLSDVTDFVGITVSATYAVSAYTLTYTSGANGSISGTTPQIVNHGASGTAVTAVPNTGYHFMQWSDGVLTATRTDSNVIGDISVTASFAINQYTLTYTPGANGSISGTTPQIVNHGASGTAVTAVPNTGYHFMQWSDGVLTATRTDSNVIGDISVTASFAINQYTLTYTPGANGLISGTTPQVVNHGASGTAVTAVPNTGYHFMQWSDGVLTATRTDSNAIGDISVTASFARSKGTVIVQVTPGAAPWTFLDGDGASHGGVGDAVVPDITTGQITLTWVPLSGFITPQTESQTLTRGGTVTFEGVYGPVVVFTTAPQDQRHYVGDTATFEVAATGGVGVLHYEWWFDDGRKSRIPIGDDSPILNVAGVTLGDAGRYWCEVTDEYPATYSSLAATLETAEHLQITQHPLGGDKRAGESHTFSVGASGGFGVLSYAWQKDGDTIAGAESAFYTIPALAPDDAGIYTAVVSDELTDLVQSNTAMLSVTVPSVPLSGLAGAAAMLAAFGFGGAFIIRRKQGHR